MVKIARHVALHLTGSRTLREERTVGFFVPSKLEKYIELTIDFCCTVGHDSQVNKNTALSGRWELRAVTHTTIALAYTALLPAKYEICTT